MTENIARIVRRELGNRLPPATEPVSVTTAHLLATVEDLEGARFDDIYTHVMAFLLTHDGSVKS